MEIWNPGYTKFTYFWGEWPFSQWSDAEFEIDGYKYCSNEQYMMAEKARFFGDEETANLIMDTECPREQKKLGRCVSPFDPEKWNEVSREIVKKGNKAKFDQMPDAKEALMATRGTLLVEASPYDTIWGIGLGVKDAEDGKTWRGTNWLGEVLTQIRDEYDEESYATDMAFQNMKENNDQ